MNVPASDISAATLMPVLSLADLLRTTAAAHPDVTALVIGEQRLSYRDLDRGSDDIARAVTQYLPGSMGNPTVVGLLAGREPEAVLGLFGIMKAGAAYLPFDPEHPFARIDFMLQDSGAVLLLATDEALASMPRADELSLPVLRLKEALAAPPPPIAAANAGPGPRDAAYVIYTSGSTGVPKGVVIEHVGAVNLALAHRELFDLHAGDRALLFASFAFDASVSEMVSAIAAGATLVLASEAERRLPSALGDLIERHEIKTATFPPSLLAHLPRRDYPALRTVCVAGEVCAERELAYWSIGRRLINAYGPTEASVSACASIYQQGDPPTCIGKAHPGVLLQILDEAGRPVPEGADGELYIGGVGVARGYLNRPELTAERFVDSAVLDGRAYRTGDRVRWLEPGVLEFRGRIDDQVKVAGYRIEPSEVAAALERFPGVRQAAVIAQEDERGRRLIAFYVPSQPLPTPASLAEELARWLPTFMLPAAYVARDSLPLTISGKIDRAALAAMDVDATTPASAATPTEQALVELWCEILGVDSVRLTDNFYALGGDSLRLTRLLIRVNDAFGTALVASRFRRLADLAALAAHVDQQAY